MFSFHPVDAPITQEFGLNPIDAYQPYGHMGRDYGCGYNVPIRAIGPGRVIWADWSDNMPPAVANLIAAIPYGTGSGIQVVLDHGNGVGSSYAHNTSTHLNVGDWVEAGQTIARAGTTGNSTGVHCHLEVFLFAQVWSDLMYGRKDPTRYISDTPPPTPIPLPKVATRSLLIAGIPDLYP